DTRGAFNASWSRWLNPDWNMTLGGGFSTEYDFQSISANALLARDFNKRNATLSMGLSLEADTIDPVGGTPLAMTPMPVAGDAAFDGCSTSESKTVTDVLFGVTQVLNRNAIAQLNYTYSVSDG